jgi:hypothetical protein
MATDVGKSTAPSCTFVYFHSTLCYPNQILKYDAHPLYEKILEERYMWYLVLYEECLST